MNDEWVGTRLSDVAQVLMGQSPPGRSYNTLGKGLPFLQGSAEFGEHTPKPVKWCSEPTKIAEPGDLLVSVRAPVGDTNFADQRIAYGRGLAVVRAGDDAMTEYLRLVVQHSTRELLARSGGGMFSSITAGNLRGFEILLPPLAVQRRIVDLLEHLDTHIANLEAETRSLGLLLSVLRNRTFESLGKETVAAGEMFEMLLGRQKSERQSVGDHVIPYLRAANISDEGLKLGDVQTMNFDPREQQKYGLRPDDVLLVEGGSVGLATRWQGEMQGNVGFDKHLIRLRARTGCSTSEYALQWARWSRERGAFDKQATGITIRALGFGRASAMSVPKVSLEDQEEQMAPLAAAQEVLSRHRLELAALHSLRSMALASILSREVEIPASYDDLLVGVAS